MAIKPSPTIAGKLRKLFSNNKQTIEPAIGDSIPGGSGGGALIIHETEDETYTGEGVKYVLDVTTEELLAAARAGRVIVMQEAN